MLLCTQTQVGRPHIKHCQVEEKKTLFCSLGKLPMEKIKVPIVLLTKMFINLDILLVGTMMKEFSLLGTTASVNKEGI